ncbi:hypothetical protein M0R45_018738 [Rubus argutus]|uniref:F-box associated beta-propeller type 1 domain-containing protein n=1 Tax=Rubus argutus TaxID=59490 RepID=A0AAW1X5A9_RUBAR
MERKTIYRKVNSSPSSFSSAAAETVANIEELLTEILLCVPARSVVRLKFCSHAMVYCYAIPPMKNTSSLFLVTVNTHLGLIPSKLLTLIIRSVTIRMGWDRRFFSPAMASSSAFHCLQKKKKQYHPIYVVNPTTNQFSTLFPPRAGKSTVFVRYALAFDPSESPHYKVVCLSTTQNHNWVHQVDIYSSETRTWRLLETPYASKDFEMHLDRRSREGGVYCNGAVHWLRDENEVLIRVGDDANSWVREDADLLHYYDIGEERLGLAVPSPPLVVSGYFPSCLSKFPKFDHRYFGESGGHLYLIDVYKESSTKYKGQCIYKDCNAQFDVMEMRRDYSGWFVKYHVDLNPVVTAFRGYYDTFSRFYVLFLGGEGKDEHEQQQQEEGSLSLLFHIPGKVISYNVKNKTFKTFVDLAIKDYFLVGGCSYRYMETLACV